MMMDLTQTRPRRASNKRPSTRPKNKKNCITSKPSACCPAPPAVWSELEIRNSEGKVSLRAGYIDFACCWAHHHHHHQLASSSSSSSFFWPH